MADRSARNVATERDVARFQAELARWLADVAERRAKMGARSDPKRGGQAA